MADLGADGVERVFVVARVPTKNAVERGADGYSGGLSQLSRERFGLLRFA